MYDIHFQVQILNMQFHSLGIPLHISLYLIFVAYRVISWITYLNLWTLSLTRHHETSTSSRLLAYKDNDIETHGINQQR
jgi:hypothetical protein